MSKMSFAVLMASVSLHGVAHCQTLPSGSPLTKKSFFPIAVSLQNPTYIGTAGNASILLAKAAHQAGVNIFHGLKGIGTSPTWPESFGSDMGEIAAIAGNDLYVIGGTDVPFNTEDPPSITGAGLGSPATRASDTCNDKGSAQDRDGTLCSTIASIKKLIARSPSYATALIGYNVSDEPDCGLPPYYHPNNEMVASATGPISKGVSEVVAGVTSQDHTRIVTDNFAPNVFFGYCPQSASGAIRALAKSWISFDLYPATIPYSSYTQFSTGTDYVSVSNDTLWLQGLEAANERMSAPSGTRLSAYVETGSDDLGGSAAANQFSATLTKGSTVLTIPPVSAASGNTASFSSTWIGLNLTGKGLPASATVVSVTNGQTAVLSAPATATVNAGTVTVTGGAPIYDGGTGNCVASANFCVVSNNEYRATPVEVSSEAWMSLISGMNVLEWFCQDSTSVQFCLGDILGGQPENALSVYENIKYVDSIVSKYGSDLNSLTYGICSMQRSASHNFATSKSCTDGDLKMQTDASGLPGLAMLKFNPDVGAYGTYYLFAMSDRRSTTGATFTFTISGLEKSEAKARLVYDQNSNYDSGNSESGTVFPLSAGVFSDSFGKNNDHYQVKVYAIPATGAVGGPPSSDAKLNAFLSTLH